MYGSKKKNENKAGTKPEQRKKTKRFLDSVTPVKEPGKIKTPADPKIQSKGSK